MPSRDLQRCHPALIYRYLTGRRAFEDAHPGRDLLITATYRSAEEQQRLFQVGRTVPPIGRKYRLTNCDGVTRLSNHNRDPSHALDFAVTVEGKITWDPEEYDRVGPYMVQAGLIWGKGWSDGVVQPEELIDRPHVELPVSFRVQRPPDAPAA